MKKSFQNFIQFLKRPDLIKASKDRKLLMTEFGTLFLIDIIFTALLFSIFGLLLHFNLVKEYNGIDFLKEYGVLGSLALACVFAPFIEELLFRWHLKDLNGSIYFFTLSMGLLITSQISNHWVQFGVIIGAIALAATVISFLRKKPKIYSLKKWKKCYPFLFYYTAVIFGLIHLSNYKELSIADPSFVFYIGSQAFGGLSLGYLRIKYGLIYGMLFHAFFNLVVFSLAILFR